MCKNKGLTEDHSDDLYATVNYRGYKYGENNMPSWQNFTGK